MKKYTTERTTYVKTCNQCKNHIYYPGMANDYPEMVGAEKRDYVYCSKLKVIVRVFDDENGGWQDIPDDCPLEDA